MSDSQRLLDVYETIAQVSGEMLVAARDGDWTSLSHAGREVERLVQGLRMVSEAPTLDFDNQRLRIDLLRKILADDAEIRDLTEPWMVKLEMMMNTRKARWQHSGQSERAM